MVMIRMIEVELTRSMRPAEGGGGFNDGAWKRKTQSQLLILDIPTGSIDDSPAKDPDNDAGAT